MNPHSLTDLAHRLHNDRLVRVFQSFLENRACISRVVLQVIVTLWACAWQFGSQPVLVRDAQAVFPWSLGLLAFSVVWMVLVRRRIIPPAPWLDAVGFGLNLLFIAIQIKLAFILLIPLNALLPFITIAAVARYGKQAVKPSLIATFLVLAWSGPPGYWLSRPAYFLYAMTLTLALPWLVSRIILATHEVALQSLASRDHQSRFVSTMSHELRTPLNALINCAHLIDASKFPAGERELIDAVSTNADALRHRVEEVLDVARIDAGQMQLRSQSVNLDQVLHMVHAAAASQSSVCGVVFEIVRDWPAPPWILGDGGRIEQVITNLVNNAIKFTPPGGSVEVRASGRQAHGAWEIEVRVADTGVGIDDAQKPRIFDAQFQLDEAGTRAGGIGLGLFIVKSVVDRMDSTLAVTDNTPTGTVFTWTFAAPAAQEGNQLAPRTTLEILSEHRAGGRPVHCLVFEDIPTNRLVMRELLTRAGHAVSFFPDGSDALQRILESEADIVFLDLHMPGHSGWTVLEQLQAHPGGHPPVVVLTADTLVDTVEAARAMGAVAFLSKPIDVNELLSVVDRHARTP